MLETLGPRFNVPNRGASLFLMGMFSLLDAILRRPLTDVLSELNLEVDIADALMGRGSADHPLRRMFALVTAHERADWDTVKASAASVHLDLGDLAKEHLQAQQWVREAAPRLTSQAAGGFSSRYRCPPKKLLVNFYIAC
ncbi:MAG TPA: hypothetical protein VLM42_15030 [Bryobacteraceae bacterium]|nr:hypothetical protein [Bryobacteraceae bacterium]